MSEKLNYDSSLQMFKDTPKGLIHGQLNMWRRRAALHLGDDRGTMGELVDDEISDDIKGIYNPGVHSGDESTIVRLENLTRETEIFLALPEPISIEPSTQVNIQPRKKARLGRYDSDYQMYINDERDPHPATLHSLRWAAEQGKFDDDGGLKGRLNSKDAPREPSKIHSEPVTIVDLSSAREAIVASLKQRQA